MFGLPFCTTTTTWPEGERKHLNPAIRLIDLRPKPLINFHAKSDSSGGPTEPDQPPGTMRDAIDYNALQHSLDLALLPLRDFQISPTRVHIQDDTVLMSGGFGDVVCATLEGEQLTVAVKKLRPTGSRTERIRMAVRLVREIRVWSKLRHPNILSLIGFHLDSDFTLAWLISPYEANGNVAQYLLSEKPGVDVRLRLAADTARGLKYLHQLDPCVIHGDIKSANALVTQDIRAILCDFGLSRLMQADPTGLTTSASVKGSARYQSPELLEDGAVHSRESDVWAWGCVLFEILTDKLPYAEARMDPQVYTRIIQGNKPAAPPLYASFDRRIKQLLESTWDSKPRSRPSIQRCLAEVEILCAPTPQATGSKSLSHPNAGGTFQLRPRTPKLPGGRAAGTQPTLLRPGDIQIGLTIPSDSPEVFDATLRGNHYRLGMVVLKRLKPALQSFGKSDYFLQKVRAWEGLNHPFLLPVLGIMRDDNRCTHLVSPFLDIGSLSEYLHEHPNADRVKFIQELASALSYLHGLGLVHGDVRGANVLVSAKVNALLCDVGVAATVETSSGSSRAESRNVRWTAPELLDTGDQTPRTSQSDVYSFGMTIFEILSGRVPLGRYRTPGDVVQALLRGERPPPEPASSATGLSYQILWYVASQCWSQKPQRRPTMDAALAHLDSIPPET